MRVLGIDPGKFGALALLDASPGTAPSLIVHDMPTHRLQVGKSTRDRVDMYSLWALLQAYAAIEPTLIVLEDIESGGVRPGQSGGVAFGKCAGALEAYVIALRLRIHLVPPSTWKRTFGVKAGDTAREKSDAARLAASQAFPGFAHMWSRVKDDGRAEAALLAQYGATKVLGLAS